MKKKILTGCSPLALRSLMSVNTFSDFSIFHKMLLSQRHKARHNYIYRFLVNVFRISFNIYRVLDIIFPFPNNQDILILSFKRSSVHIELLFWHIKKIGILNDLLLSFHANVMRSRSLPINGMPVDIWPL